MQTDILRTMQSVLVFLLALLIVLLWFVSHAPRALLPHGRIGRHLLRRVKQIVSLRLHLVFAHIVLHNLHFLSRGLWNK